MRKIPSIAAFFLLGLILIAAGCGKKGPPLLPQKEFDLRVTNLSGKWEKGYFLLRGELAGSLRPQEVRALIAGCRVYQGQYPLDDAPCAGCPIEYRHRHDLGPEVITEEGFQCRVPGKIKGQVYFFKVHLVGKEGSPGPPSNRIPVTVK